MRKREITATGMINNNGGLAMYMGELNEFFQGLERFPDNCPVHCCVARFVRGFERLLFQLCCTHVSTRHLGGGRTSYGGTNGTEVAGVFPNYVRRAGQRGNREIFPRIAHRGGIVERRVNRAYRNTQTDCRRALQHVY